MEILNDKLQHINDNLIYFIVYSDYDLQKAKATKLNDAITLREHIRNNPWGRISAVTTDDEIPLPNVAYLNPDEVDDLAHHQHLCEMY